MHGADPVRPHSAGYPGCGCNTSAVGVRWAASFTILIRVVVTVERHCLSHLHILGPVHFVYLALPLLVPAAVHDPAVPTWGARGLSAILSAAQLLSDDTCFGLFIHLLLYFFFFRVDFQCTGVQYLQHIRRIIYRTRSSIFKSIPDGSSRSCECI